MLRSMQAWFLSTLSAFAVVALLAAPTIAADNALPGVESTHRIVKPLPQEPDDTEPSGPRTFKVGNFEVVVRGKITVEFGFGEKPRRRK